MSILLSRQITEQWTWKTRSRVMHCYRAVHVTLLALPDRRVGFVGLRIFAGTCAGPFWPLCRSEAGKTVAFPFVILYHLLISASSLYIGCCSQLSIRAKLRLSAAGTCFGRCLFLLFRSENDSGNRAASGKVCKRRFLLNASYVIVLSSLRLFS